jgi:hypothetical protein
LEGQAKVVYGQNRILAQLYVWIGLLLWNSVSEGDASIAAESLPALSSRRKRRVPVRCAQQHQQEQQNQQEKVKKDENNGKIVRIVIL